MSNENSLLRKEKREKSRSYQIEEFGMTFIIFEKKTKRGKWIRSGRMRIK
jgi:hypothetical protein